MATRGEKCRAGDTWTEARYFAFIRGALRRAAAKYPVKYQVKDAARRNKPEGKAGRHRFEYQCNGCKKWFQGKEVEVDHIEPAGSLKTFSDLPAFTERLFCEADNMQVLCKKCHRKKTNEERKA
jgi:5-methylcytosine-specific restriction endonuclease McrA